jgi:hypothetical protein
MYFIVMNNFYKNSNSNHSEKERKLNEEEKGVIEAIRMRLTTDQSLQYLKDNGFSMSRASYFRHKKKLEEKKLKRLYEIAKIGFEDQHLDRIDNIELCLKLMWQNYNEEQDPFKKFHMLKDIILVQPYLSAYYETTKLIVEKPLQEQQNEVALSNNTSINDDVEFNNDNNAKF